MIIPSLYTTLQSQNEGKYLVMQSSNPSPFMGSYILGSHICRVGPRLKKFV